MWSKCNQAYICTFIQRIFVILRDFLLLIKLCTTLIKNGFNFELITIEMFHNIFSIYSLVITYENIFLENFLLLLYNIINNNIIDNDKGNKMFDINTLLKQAISEINNLNAGEIFCLRIYSKGMNGIAYREKTVYY